MTLSAVVVAAATVLCAASGFSATRAAIGATTVTPLVAEVDARCASVADERLPPYPWPLAPVHRQHPVRGYFGDPRTVLTGPGEGAFSFHNGVDISAWPGNRVLPVVSGIVTTVLADRVVVASSFDRRFQYIHIHPSVRLGAHVIASRTVLGTVDPVAHHVHLSEIRGMCVVNPLMPGHLTPYRDTTRPVVAAIYFETLSGKRLDPLALSGRVRVVARAYDLPALPSHAPWGSMPVSPALIRWQLATVRGRVLRNKIAVDFRSSIPPRQDFCSVYAPGTIQNFAVVFGHLHWRKPGRYLYELTPNLLNTSRLDAGRYRFTVTAADTAGNLGSRTVTIGIVGSRLTRAARVAPSDSRCQAR